MEEAQLTFSQMLQLISSGIISFAGVITALAVICKPVRKFFLKSFLFISGAKKDEELRQLIIDKETKLFEKIEEVSNKCDDNEKDRLRNVIFSYGHQARKHEEIDGEEFEFLRHAYDRYLALGGNDLAHHEFEFIEKYYNNSGWRVNN